MSIEKGKGPTAAMSLGCGVAALIISGASHAALVTVTGVVTNNTATTQTYEFFQRVRVGETLAQVGVFGSVSFTVTDFNRDGATIESDTGKLYSGLIGGSLAKSFLPVNAPPAFRLVAPARSMNTYNGSFGSAGAPEMLTGRTLNPGDEIEIRLNFRLSAGDQAAYTGVFNVVPGPGAACLAMIAPWIGLHRRRRTENDR